MASVSIGDIWDRTTGFLGENLGAVVPIALGAMVAPSVLGTWLQAVTEGASPVTRAIVAVALVGLGIVSLWGQLAVGARALDTSVGRRATRTATARLLPAIGVYLVIALAFFAVVALPILLLAFGSGIDLSQFSVRDGAQPTIRPEDAGAALWIGLAAIVLSLGTLFVLVRLAPLTGVILAERRGIGAIARAWGLTRGMWWKLVGVFLLYGIVSWVAGAAAKLVFGGVFAFTLGREGASALVATAVPVALVSAAFTVLATVFGAKLYLATSARDVAATFDTPIAETAA